MARLCEQGGIAQSDTVVQQQVFGGAAIENLKVGVGLLLDQGSGVTDSTTFSGGTLYDSPSPATDQVLAETAAETPPGDNAPVSSQIVITNT